MVHKRERVDHDDQRNFQQKKGRLKPEMLRLFAVLSCVFAEGGVRNLREVVNPAACVVEVVGGIILWTGRRLGTASEANLKSFTKVTKVRFLLHFRTFVTKLSEMLLRPNPSRCTYYF